MAISQTVCTVAIAALWGGTLDVDTDVLKIALYTSAATLGVDTTVYTTTNEVTGTGYVAGGNTLAGAVIATAAATATTPPVVYIDFTDSTWTGSTITARGALIYDSTRANMAVAVLDFGADKTTANQPFTVVFPAATGTNAILRASTS